MNRWLLTSSVVSLSGVAAIVTAADDGPHVASASSMTAPSTQRIDMLIRQLGDRSFAQREAAQSELKAMGDAAITRLVAHVQDEDSEIAARACALVRSAGSGELRVEASLRLMQTGKPAMIEQAVEMLFDDADAVVEPLRRATSRPATPRRVAVASGIIVQQLESWIQFRKTGMRLYEIHKTKDPKQAQVDLANLEEQRKTLQLLAYSEASDESLPGAASRPATRPYP